LFTRAHGRPRYYLGARFPQPGTQEGSQNPSKFQPVPRTLPNHQNVTQGTQKPLKMRSQTLPNCHKSKLYQKLENLQKPLFLQCKQHIQASDRGPISNPKPLINTPRTQTINLVTQITKKSPKCHQMGIQRGDQIHLKSIKSMLGPSCVPLGGPGHPWTSKMVLQGTKMVPKWGPKPPKWQLWMPKSIKMTFRIAWGFENWQAFRLVFG